MFETLHEAGQKFGLKLVGGEALNALRIKKGLVHWGHEMTYTETSRQLRLDFICKPDKPTPFIGRDGEIAGLQPVAHMARPPGASVGLCLLSPPKGETGRASETTGAWPVRVKGRANAAEISPAPFYDPKNAAMLG